MTRRRIPITTMEQADRMDFRWLLTKCNQPGAVRDMLDCLNVYRGRIHALERLLAHYEGEEKKPGFAERIEARRK